MRHTPFELIFEHPSSRLQSWLATKYCTMRAYSQSYFDSFGRHYYSVILSRSVPAIRTGICIPAALSDIGVAKYVVFTMLGNLIYAALCYAVFFTLIPKDLDYRAGLFVVFGIVALLWTAHIVHYVFWKRHKTTTGDC